jgi:uncharacterized cupredoxin-like copper-binding protein
MIRKSLLLIVFSLSVSFAQFLGPRISIQQIEHNFGDIQAGKVVTHNFILTNTGDDNLVIKNVHATCGCTVAKPQKETLAPGESTKLKVDFNSTGRRGPQEKTVYVKTNDPKNPELKLKISANVIASTAAAGSAPILYVPKLSHDFGESKRRKVVEHTFTITNKGNAPLVIKDVRTSCGCTAALLSSKNIEPGKNGTIKVELDTKNRLGKQNRTITLVTNDVNEPNKVLTIQANVEN